MGLHQPQHPCSALFLEDVFALMLRSSSNNGVPLCLRNLTIGHASHRPHYRWTTIKTMDRKTTTALLSILEIPNLTLVPSNELLHRGNILARDSWAASSGQWACRMSLGPDLKLSNTGLHVCG